MNARRRIALVLCAFLLAGPAAAPAAAAVGDLKSTLRSDAVEAKATGGTAAMAARADADLKAILKKSEANAPLTRAEFRTYLRAVEAANPGKDWKTLISKIHHAAYPQATDFVLFGIDLFKNGKQNEGFEDVDILTRQPPKFVVGEDGKVVKVDHAYAGVRAAVNRNRVSANVMGRVNTGWGDSGQVFFERLFGASKWLWGAVTMDKEQRDKGAKQWATAPGYKTPDQVRGNALGMETQSWLRRNPDAKISDAFETVLASGASLD